MIPDYSNSGGKGKTRKASNSIKRGRPRKYKKVAEIGEGINITEEDRKIFRIAISKFYNNRKGNFLTTAYELMLKDYYSEEIVYDGRGVRKSVLIPPGKRPTVRQFRYWYDKEHKKDIRKTISSRRGSRAFALEHRAINRGELAGKNVETSINNLGIRIENAAPYRGDRKGIVERHFKTMHGKVKPFVPGYVDVDSTQRGKDYRLDAKKLNIDKFTEAIIYLILEHNNNHYLDDYQRDTGMIADDVMPIPKELWQWGITNRSGRLKTFPEDIVKLNLMPSGRATITARGIKFKKLHYTCEKARKEQWFERARSGTLGKNEKYLDISYDPRKPEYIYIRSSDGKSYEKCSITDPEERYIGKTWEDIDYLLASEQLQEQKYKGKETQTKVDLMAEFENIVEQATASTDAVRDKTISNSKKVKGIKDNRTFEKEKRREGEAFELNKDESPSFVAPIEETAEFKPKTTSDKIISDQPEQKTKSFKRKKLEALKRNRLKRSIDDE